jgi:hypothetical protein
LRDYYQRLKEETTTLPIPPTYYSDAPKWRIGLDSDVKQYIELVEAGKLYEHLMSKFGIDGRRRNRFKRSFFANVFYARPETTRRYAAEFAQLFPKVYQAVLHYKRHDYRDLPLLMQEAEADLMIGTVCAKLVRDCRHVPFLTIHDSILTTPEHVQAIKVIMRDAFACLGLSPTFQITVY